MSAFSTMKLFFSPFHTVVFKRSHYMHPIGKSWKVMFYLLKEEVVSTYILWNLGVQEICLFLPFFNLFNHFFLSEWTCGYLLYIYLFYTFCFNRILFYLHCCSKCAIYGHWAFFQLPPGSLLHTPIIMCLFLIFFIFSTCLLSGTARCWRYILYISCSYPRINHFPMISLEFTIYVFRSSKFTFK